MMIFMLSCNNDANKTTDSTSTAATTTQSSDSSKPRYSDIVTENPNAEADIKVVSDLMNALVAADTVTAKALLANNYMGYGPSSADSANSEKTISNWQANYKTQTNLKVNFLSESFRVKSGPQQGDWVSVWGDYSFTQDGKDIKFPLQYTAKVNNGKVETDRVYYDNLHIVQQLGYTVTPPVKK